MGYCSFNESSEEDNVYNKNKSWCLNNGHQWKIYDSNFDNAFQSLLTLFIISNLEGWVEILYHAVDSNEESIVLKLKIILFFF